ncbi:hypothetical protein C1645_841535 [Glomus cerebriforme]|uniref:Uncharacterized protein n=1 Tax=Glomus cerebriforme TaxID=658196 RepID=A0A397RXW9_9GLOM|nr:hypothetical protein C1645_841535 [Glomus cerebriforme]
MAIIAGATVVAKLQVKIEKSFTALVIFLMEPYRNTVFVVESINPWLGGLSTTIIVITFMITIPRLGVAVVLCVVFTVN